MLPISVIVFCALVVFTSASAQQTLGLLINDTPSPGYTLFAPIPSTETYLINNDGLFVHSWSSSSPPGTMAYLLDNGDLLRSTRKDAGIDLRWFTAPGRGGGIEQHDWDGNLLWSMDLATATSFPHHDIEPLPNGNVLMVLWDVVFESEAIALGMNPANVTGEVWMDKVIEIQPTPPVGGTIVWEWHSKDHLIQDFDNTKANFGVVADHPERIDINYGGPGVDWSHLNGIDYNPDLDQIVLSNHTNDELWVIDHSTTTAEAAGSSGGDSGKGGDLLYRWGNPEFYDRGDATDKKLFSQHDTQWIPPGRPGAGNILIFNNGVNRPGGEFSSVDEIVPPVDGNGEYTLPVGLPYGPTSLTWSYEDDPPTSWYSAGRSGAERMINGNTLICQAEGGRFFEVETDGTIVWEYISPIKGAGPAMQGDPAVANGVFKIRRYAPDHPGLAGRDLTPGDPLELFTPPLPVPAGSLLAGKVDAAGSSIDVEWDAFSCTSFDYKLVYGQLGNVADATLDGADCAIGTGGFHSWSGVPSGSLFFLVVGTDDSGFYESSWGRSSTSVERSGTKASFLCGSTTKVVSQSCP